ESHRTRDLRRTRRPPSGRSPGSASRPRAGAHPGPRRRCRAGRRDGPHRTIGPNERWAEPTVRARHGGRGRRRRGHRRHRPGSGGRGRAEDRRIRGQSRRTRRLQRLRRPARRVGHPHPRGGVRTGGGELHQLDDCAQRALEALHLPFVATLLVTGAAGGYLAQLAHHAGLRVITSAGPGDDDLVRSFGADQIVHRGPDAAREVVALVPGGVDAVADAALLGDDIVGAIRDGGQLATFRHYHGDPGRGIQVHGLNVRQRATDHPAITHLRDLVN
ncbi:LOW QUALITY PROTEIN: hypothetical protein OPAG_05010, partial [Rhodococcus opacus PD630]